MDTRRIKLWDLPIRLFHWSLVLLILAAIVTGKIGGNAIVWHGRIGLLLLGLIVFRIVWGVIGSSHARFASFFPTPSTVRAYLQGRWHGIGHNPLGAFSVLGLLALISFQVASGLLGNDDIAFNGPLADLISKALSDKLTGLHKLSVNLLIALIALHLAAILYYVHIKKDNLLKPMLTGWKDLKPGQGESAKVEKSASGGGAVALVVALLIALAAIYGGSGAWLPAPPPVVTAPPAASW
jgi:cytochrome b